MKKIYALLLLSFCLIQSVMADSPLTTTSFAQVYNHVPIVQQAMNSKEKLLTKAMIEYIGNPKNPIDVKLSIINALGYGNNDNAIHLQLYLEHKYQNADYYLNAADASELITLAYAYSLNNYTDLHEALFIAHYARLKAPKSMSVKIIMGLMEAQLALDFDWQMVYRAVNDVIVNKSLQQDMNPRCIECIMEYIGGYKNYHDFPSIF